MTRLSNPLGLSPAAKKRRRNYLTASDAARVMSGDWVSLWREKKGFIEEDNLDDELRVQLGSFTEPFGLWWFERTTGRQVDYYSDNLVCAKAWAMLTGRDAKSEWQQSVEHLWMGCSLDALSTTLGGAPCVLDQKHVGQFRFEELTERYTAAMTHQCVVMDVDHWILSVLVGNSRFEVIEQAADPFFREELIDLEAEFWEFVVKGIEPPDRRPTPTPKPQPRRRDVNLNGGSWSSDGQTLIADPAWPNWALPMIDEFGTFERTHGAAVAHALSRDAIKKLVPEDVGLIVRGQVQVKQDGRGITIALKEGT